MNERKDGTNPEDDEWYRRPELRWSGQPYFLDVPYTKQLVNNRTIPTSFKARTLTGNYTRVPVIDSTIVNQGAAESS